MTDIAIPFPLATSAYGEGSFWCCSGETHFEEIFPKLPLLLQMRTCEGYATASATGVTHWTGATCDLSSGLSFLRRPWSGRMQATAIALLLLVLPIGASTGGKRRGSCIGCSRLSSARRAQYFLFRLRCISRPNCSSRASMSPSPTTSWASLADEAAAEYKSGPDEDHHSGWPLFRRGRCRPIWWRAWTSGAPVKLALAWIYFPHQPGRTRWALYQLLHCQWKRRTCREDQATPRRTGERRRGEIGYGAPHNRQERTHAEHGDQRHRRGGFWSFDAVGGATDGSTCGQAEFGRGRRFRNGAQITFHPTAGLPARNGVGPFGTHGA